MNNETSDNTQTLKEIARKLRNDLNGEWEINDDGYPSLIFPASDTLILAALRKAHDAALALQPAAQPDMNSDLLHGAKWPTDSAAQPKSAAGFEYSSSSLYRTVAKPAAPSESAAKE